MADAQASGACYGNIVWVQVPSSAVRSGTEMIPIFLCFFLYKKEYRSLDRYSVVEPTGLEPMTSRTSSGRSSQLSYGSV